MLSVEVEVCGVKVYIANMTIIVILTWCNSLKSDRNWVPRCSPNVASDVFSINRKWPRRDSSALPTFLPSFVPWSSKFDSRCGRFCFSFILVFAGCFYFYIMPSPNLLHHLRP